MTYNNVTEDEFPFIEQQNEYQTDIFAPIQIEGHPGYTIRRVGVLTNGRFMWQLDKNGVKIADINYPAIVTKAKIIAAKYIEKYER